MKKLLLTTTALLAFAAATPASADILDFGGGTNPLNDTVFTTNASTATLTVAGPIPAGNQPENVQCIICGTQQPQQDGLFGYNNYKQGGNITTFATSSTSGFDANGHGTQLDNNTLGDGYTGSFLRTFFLAAVGAQFDGVINVGIDVNTAQGAGPEVLERFAVVDLVNHVILADTGQIHLALPTLNNGSGFPDYTISGFDIDRNDILPNTQLAFLARWSNTSDGAESFFLIPEAAAVPLPLAGAGIPGLIAGCFAMYGFARNRRRRSDLSVA